MNRIVTRTTIGTLAATLVFATSPAHAATRTFVDATGDTGGSGAFDISTVKVTNTKKATSVTLRVPAQGADEVTYGQMRIYLDTNRKKSGPEYLFIADYPGSHTFVPVKKNRPQYKKAWYDIVKTTKCEAGVSTSFRLDRGQVKLRVKHVKGCLGNPRSVRVNVRTTTYEDQTDENSEPENDYYPTRSGYTPSIKR